MTTRRPQPRGRLPGPITARTHRAAFSGCRIDAQGRLAHPQRRWPGNNFNVAGNAAPHFLSLKNPMWPGASCQRHCLVRHGEPPDQSARNVLRCRARLTGVRRACAQPAGARRVICGSAGTRRSAPSSSRSCRRRSRRARHAGRRNRRRLTARREQELADGVVRVRAGRSGRCSAAEAGDRAASRG